MQAKKIDLNKVRDSFMAAKERKGGGGNFLKLNANETIIRLLPNFDAPGESPGIRYRSHTWKMGGKLMNALEWAWFVTTELAERAVELGKTTNAELESADTYGDPFTILATKFQQFDEDVPNGLWARTSYLFNAIKRGDEDQVGILRLSQSLVDMIGGLLEEFPEVFDPSEDGFDIKIVGNGEEGLRRRYTSVGVVRQPRDVGVENIEEKVKDLGAVVINDLFEYDKKVDALFTMYGDDVTRFGLSASDFGG
jgi:hypothetical protein